MERNPDGSGPRLLVSVRSLQEADEAIAGGCDILDIKEPRRGSLGAASEETIQEVAKSGRRSGVPVSAALGECTEWQRSESLLQPGAVAKFDLQFVKLGLAGMRQRQNWAEEWLCLAARCAGKAAAGARHVAVVYADWQTADAPCPQEILDVVSRTTRTRQLPSGERNGLFSGVLIDTFEKSSGRLLDAMDPQEIQNMRQQTAACGLFLGLAGRLTQAMLPQLVSLAPDIVAVRSAACRGQQRNADVERTTVSQFRQSMRSCWGPGAGGTARVNGSSHV